MVYVELSEEEVSKLIDIVKEKGADLVKMKLDMESKGVPEISRSILDYIESDIDMCESIYNKLLG